MGKFELYQDKRQKYRFRLRSAGGRIILKSQGYTTPQSAKKGIVSVISSSKDEKKFSRKNGNNGKYYFNLKAKNGEVVGTSSYQYASEGGLELGIRSVMRNAVAEAEIMYA